MIYSEYCIADIEISYDNNVTEYEIYYEISLFIIDLKYYVCVFVNVLFCFD